MPVYLIFLRIKCTGRSMFISTLQKNGRIYINTDLNRFSVKPPGRQWLLCLLNASPTFHPGAKLNLLAASKGTDFSLSTSECHHWEPSSSQGYFGFFPRFQPAAGLMERIQAIAQNVSDIAIKVDQILRNSLLNGKGECSQGSPRSKPHCVFCCAHGKIQP